MLSPQCSSHVFWGLKDARDFGIINFMGVYNTTFCLGKLQTDSS